MNAKEIKAAQLQKLKEECENKGISFDSMKRLLESEKVKKLQKKWKSFPVPLFYKTE